MKRLKTEDKNGFIFVRGVAFNDDENMDVDIHSKLKNKTFC